jgi:hypothetical protein
MLKENDFNTFVLFFVGMLIIYTINKPPTIIFKYPKFDNIKDINYSHLLDDNILSHVEYCDKNQTDTKE